MRTYEHPLEDLERDTIFEYNGITYIKGCTQTWLYIDQYTGHWKQKKDIEEKYLTDQKSVGVLCRPFLGGQFQTKLDEYLSHKIIVKVSSDVSSFQDVY